MAAGQQREGGGMNRITEPTEEGLEVASAALTEAYGCSLLLRRGRAWTVATRPAIAGALAAVDDETDDSGDDQNGDGDFHGISPFVYGMSPRLTETSMSAESSIA